MRVPIFTFARQIVLDDHLAEEVTQDTFLVVWENASGFEVGRRVVSWVFAIARNLAWTAARHCVPELAVSRLRMAAPAQGKPLGRLDEIRPVWPVAGF
ncbi:MAG: RNA polymerase sigma factor [Bacillota bacterium]